MVCPHAAIRAKAVQPKTPWPDAPATLKTMPYKGPEVKGGTYLLQVAPEDCTGCTLCVHVCPGKDKADPNTLALAMAAKDPMLAARTRELQLLPGAARLDRADVRLNMKTSQLITPLFEFSGACLGCGETPYVKT